MFVVGFVSYRQILYFYTIRNLKGEEIHPPLGDLTFHRRGGGCTRVREDKMTAGRAGEEGDRVFPPRISLRKPCVTVSPNVDLFSLY